MQASKTESLLLCLSLRRQNTARSGRHEPRQYHELPVVGWTGQSNQSQLAPGFQRGDTVNVSAGSATWTGNTLVLTTGVRLLGPGRANLTIISRSGTVADPIISIKPDVVAIANEETIRVDGFTFDGADRSLVVISVTGAGANSVKPFRNLVIGNNAFRNSQTSANFNGAVYTTGQTRGVIYNNIFDRQMVTFRCLGNNEKTEWTNGTFPFAFGNSDNLFLRIIRFSGPRALQRREQVFLVRTRREGGSAL
jgi:hypothetical protein